MRRASPLRISAALATAALLLAGLGGCFLLPEEHAAGPTAHPSPTSSPDAAEFAVGDCWTASYTQFSNWSSWYGKSAVNCNKDHQLYTFAVHDVLKGNEPPVDDQGSVTDLAYAQTTDFCGSQLQRLLGVDLTRHSRLSFGYFLPRLDQWEAGARWVRCDLSILKPGSKILEPDLADLPSRISELADVINDSPNHFDICVNTGEGWTGYGPWESESAVYGYCEDDPEWVLHGSVAYPADLDAPFPGAEALNAYTSENCLGDVDPNQLGYSYMPDEESWGYGQRQIECWFFGGDAGGPPPAA